MDATDLRALTVMRMVVGYLGEREQFGWWQSSFITPSSTAFLAPVFSRTMVLAQSSAVAHAAALVHDDRIGVGNVYHLFRLPEDIDQGIHHVLHEADLCQGITALVASKASALAYLGEQADPRGTKGIGPVRVGGIQQLRDADHWRTVVAHYLRAFEQRVEVFPYFADRT